MITTAHILKKSCKKITAYLLTTYRKYRQRLRKNSMCHKFKALKKVITLGIDCCSFFSIECIHKNKAAIYFKLNTAI
jgi:hypothetical protein